MQIAVSVWALAAATGCAGPRIVSSMDSAREGKFRFVYTQSKAFNSEQGVVDCKISPEGVVSACESLNVVFVDKEP